MGVASGRACVRLAAALVVFHLAAFAPAVTAQARPAGIDAHPVGTPVATIIEFGEQYLGSELYDGKITVLEIVRGEKAWNIVKEASSSNPAPKPGFDYILARVKFEFSARTSPAPDSYSLNETQFAATDADGRQFSAPDLAAYLQPRLNGTLKPGDSLEGWVAFLVPRSVSKPLMVFREDVGTVSHRGGGTWFELFIRPSSAPLAK